MAVDNPQITVITSPACASENSLKDLTILSSAIVFAAGLSDEPDAGKCRPQKRYLDYGGLIFLGIFAVCIIFGMAYSANFDIQRFNWLNDKTLHWPGDRLKHIICLYLNRISADHFTVVLSSKGGLL